MSYTYQAGSMDNFAVVIEHAETLGLGVEAVSWANGVLIVVTTNPFPADQLEHLGIEAA